MDNLVFHIGYHKTATTWLQAGYFSEHPKILLVADYRKPWQDEYLSYLIQTSEKTFSVRQCQTFFEKRLDALSDVDNKVLVTSAERLSGHPYSGGYDSFILANRINSCFPKSKIIIGIRNQAEMIISVYKQLVEEGYPGTFNDLINSASWKGTTFSLEMYKYDLLIGKYFDLFSKNNVLVLVYEELLKGRVEYIKRLSNFLDIAYFEPSNFYETTKKSRSDKEISATRLLNHFRKTELNPFPLLQLRQKTINELRKVLPRFVRKNMINYDYQNYIEKYFASSNASLKKILKMELPDYP